MRRTQKAKVVGVLHLTPNIYLITAVPWIGSRFRIWINLTKPAGEGKMLRLLRATGAGSIQNLPGCVFPIVTVTDARGKDINLY